MSKSCWSFLAKCIWCQIILKTSKRQNLFLCSVWVCLVEFWLCCAKTFGLSRWGNTSLVLKQCNGERAKEEAVTHFEKLFEVLEERKSSVLKAIDTSKKLRLDKFQTQMEEYQGLLENSGLVGYAQEVLKETDQSCFVQTAKQLHLRYLVLTKNLFRTLSSDAAVFWAVALRGSQCSCGPYLLFHS